MSDTSREAFEAWAGPFLRFDPKGVSGESDPLEWVANWNGSEHYYEQQTQRMFEAWQASRAAALEEAAKVCESRFMGDLNREDQEARRCAEAVRALAAKG